MNVNKLSVAVCLMLLAVGPMAQAEAEGPYLGVRLDSEPLPALLTRHLGLDKGQGIRIQNVSVGSPADEAGLERDDIILGFQGEDVTDVERFVQGVRQAGIGATVSLEILHLGRRQVLEIELEPLKADVEWKHPPEPEIVTSWRPGKFFRIGPDGQDWIEIPFDKMPEFNVDVKDFFRERHTYQHAEDGEAFTITIEGDPNDEDTIIIVRKGQTEHSTTVKDVDALPEAYRKPVHDALDNARHSAKHTFRMKGFSLPKPPKLDIRGRYFQDMTVPRLDVDRWSEKKDRAFEELREQMERLQKRMGELEVRHREMLDRLLEKPNEGSEETEKSQDRAAPPPTDEGAV